MTTKSKVLEYSINLAERGYFEADVRDASGKTIWAIDTVSARDLVEDGFVKDLKNPGQIESYLKEMGIIEKDMQVMTSADAESAWDEENVIEFVIEQFTGFYESHHDSRIDDAISSIFQDEDGNPEVPDDFYNHFTVRGPVADAYCTKFVEAYQDYLKEKGMNIPSLEFVEVIHPREYNFTTDKIIVKAKVSELESAINAVIEGGDFDLESARKTVVEFAQSRSGFHSFHDDLVDRSKDSENPLEWFCRDIYSPLNEGETSVIMAAVIGNFDDDKIMADYFDPIHEVVESIVSSKMSPQCKAITRKYHENKDEFNSPSA